MSIYIDAGDLERLAMVLNCRVMNFPFSHLGILVGEIREGRLWDPILHKMRSKLALWKQKTLS